jgi:hypothetical protein
LVVGEEVVVVVAAGAKRLSRSIGYHRHQGTAMALHHGVS